VFFLRVCRKMLREFDPLFLWFSRTSVLGVYLIFLLFSRLGGRDSSHQQGGFSRERESPFFQSALSGFLCFGSPFSLPTRREVF